MTHTLIYVVDPSTCPDKFQKDPFIDCGCMLFAKQSNDAKHHWKTCQESNVELKTKS